MQNYKVEGIGKINGGEFETFTVEGVCSCTNNIKAEEVHIEGVFNCSGDVETNILYCEGVANFKSNIRAKRISVEGVLSEKGSSKIEAEEINCEGVIKTGGEISADVVRVDGCIEAKEIVGDQIRINYHKHLNRFRNFFSPSRCEVDLIEATTIELCGVSAHTVNGKDITIGPDCRIENLDCSGVLFIDKHSNVKNLSGNYSTRV